jgi:hypothetical protein
MSHLEIISLGDTTSKELAWKTLGVPQGLGIYEYIAFELIYISSQGHDSIA